MTTAADSHTYRLKFSGAPDDDFLADYCPAGTTLTIGMDTFTLSNLRTDQAGVLGIIRSLHNFGCTLLELEFNNGE
jgi:hypothetical protein